jgi:tetratricopeptide (TPR) repeat protein
VGNPVTLAALLGLGAPFALGFVATTPFMMRKTGWALVFTALTCAIYFTKSRGPWVGFGLATTGLIFLIFKSKGLNVKRLLGVLIVLGLVLTTFFVMNRERLGNTSGGQEDPSLYGRLMYYKAALTMIREHPITGVGFDNFRILYPKFRPPEENLTILGLDFLPTTVHNGYLQLALTNGIPGLLAYLTLVAAVLVSLIATCRRERQYERRITGAVFVASISGYLIQDLTGWPHLALTPCFWIVMALAVSFTIQNGPELKLTRLSLPIAEVATCSCVIVLGWLVLDAFNRLNADKLLYQCYTALNIGTDWPIIESKIAQALKTQRADSYCEDMAARIYMKRLSVTSDVESYYAGIRLIEQAHLHNPYDVYTLIHGLDMTMLAMKRGLIQVPSSFVEDSARKLPAMDKDNPSVYEAVAGLRFAEQKFDEAIPLIRHAQGLMPSQARYYLLEAMVYQRLQDPSRANAALKRVIHILERGAPPYTDEWVFAKCAIAINLIQAHDYAQAQKTIEDIIERFPKDADSHVMLGNLFLDLRRLDKARETFAALLRIDPSNTAAREGFERAGELEKQP